MLANSLNRGFRGSFITILVIYLLILILSIFIKDPSEHYYFPNLFYNFLTAQINSGAVNFIMNHVLLLTGITIVSYIVSNEEIVDKLNYFPVLIFMLINATALSSEDISLMLLSNVAILYSVYKIFNIYRQENVLSYIYNACFWISVTLYLNISNIFIVPFLFVTLIILRPFYWREFAIALLGFISPIFIYECLSYLFNFNQWYIFESLHELFQHFRAPVFSTHFLPFFGLILLLFVLSLLSFLSQGFGNTVKKQKAKSCFLWYIVLVSPSVFTSGINYANTLLLFSIPLAFLSGEFFFNLKSTRWSNVLLTLTITALFYYLFRKIELI